jgi:pantetheine-phosphate adenylyltransferase
MRHCIYPGTFDPLTNGHLDVLDRAAKLFDRITVAIARNPGKSPVFSVEKRLELVEANIAKYPHVSATIFEFEFNMALMNRHLQPRIETLFVMPHEQFSYTSSSLVKQVARYGGDISHFVPKNVAAALSEAFPRGR